MPEYWPHLLRDWWLKATYGGPAMSTEVIGTYAYKTFFRFFEYGKASALSIIGLLFTLIFYVALLSNVKKTLRGIVGMKTSRHQYIKKGANTVLYAILTLYTFLNLITVFWFVKTSVITEKEAFSIPAVWIPSTFTLQNLNEIVEKYAVL